VIRRRPTRRSVDLTPDEGVLARVLECVFHHLPHAFRHGMQDRRINVVSQLLPEEVRQRLAATGVRCALKRDHDVRCIDGCCRREPHAAAER